MKYMLDTDMCIYLIKKKPPSVVRRLLRTGIGDVCISSITLGELEYGVSKSARSAQNQMALAEFLAPIEVLSYDDIAAREYGPLRAELERRGTPIGSLDTLIAAHARSLGLTLVTNNTEEFGRTPGLHVQNWAS
jgi:tRNA(fMet)-specific endonuclease VapC